MKHVRLKVFLEANSNLLYGYRNGAMYLYGTVKKFSAQWLPHVVLNYKLSSLFLLCVFIGFGFTKFNQHDLEQRQTLAIVTNPKVNDILFFDERLLSDDLRPYEKYRIAKVVDVTGDIISLVYGDFFYQHKHAILNSIQYGQLSYKDYFEPKRYDTHIDAIKNMLDMQAIYLAQRPVRGRLLGQLVGPERIKPRESHLTFGKKENIKGEAFLQQPYSETNIKTAFEFFQKSSELGYAKGQINLAEMYVNGWHVDKDFVQALYWFKQASLQSNKPAILKYRIICKQVESCNINDFYQELTDYGVNIKVRNIDFTLSK